MFGYSGVMKKCLLASCFCPKIVVTEEMKQIDKELEPLYDKLELYRGKYGKPLNDEMRQLLFYTISPLEVKRHKLFVEHNKEYCEYWGIK